MVDRPAYPTDLSDAEWELIAQFIPEPKPGGRPALHERREIINALGLDHYEGRTWRGWHHHLTLVTAAQAFLTLRRLDPKAPTPA